jgi:hypothetical protein
MMRVVVVVPVRPVRVVPWVVVVVVMPVVPVSPAKENTQPNANFVKTNRVGNGAKRHNRCLITQLDFLSGRLHVAMSSKCVQTEV